MKPYSLAPDEADIGHLTLSAVDPDAAGILDCPVEPGDDSGIVGCLDVGTKATYALADGGGTETVAGERAAAAERRPAWVRG